MRYHRLRKGRSSSLSPMRTKSYEESHFTDLQRSDRDEAPMRIEQSKTRGRFEQKNLHSMAQSVFLWGEKEERWSIHLE